MKSDASTKWLSKPVHWDTESDKLVHMAVWLLLRLFLHSSISISLTVCQMPAKRLAKWASRHSLSQDYHAFWGVVHFGNFFGISRNFGLGGFGSLSRLLMLMPLLLLL